MDTVIAEAARNNVKLVIALMNNWNYNPLQTDWKCAPRLALVAQKKSCFLCTACTWAHASRAVHGCTCQGSKPERVFTADDSMSSSGQSVLLGLVHASQLDGPLEYLIASTHSLASFSR